MATAIDLTPISTELSRLQALEADLATSLLEREDAIRAGLVAIIARQHIVMIGPPGTAKSQLVAALADRIAPAQGSGLSRFMWLLTRFTTPEELFGPVSVVGLKQDQYRRITTAKLPDAELAFLDEVFKANSAVLNALLTVLNERAFDNGATRIQVPLISAFGASNELPQGEDLAALWDRFALRLMVEYVSDSGFARLMRLANGKLPTAFMTKTELETLQATAHAIPVPDGILDAICNLRKELAGKGITASDRRWRQSLDLVRAFALCEGRGCVEEDDLAILRESLWTTPDQRQEIGRTVARLANPLNAKAVELGDQAASVHQATMDAQRMGDDEAKMAAAIEGNAKLKAIAGQLKALHEQADAQGRNPARIAKIAGQVKAMRQNLAELVLG